MKQFFKKRSLLEFVALSTTIRSCRIAYFHLDTVLFIFIVLYLCFSSVSACLMQRLSFSLSEIKTYWTTLGLFSVSMSFWMLERVSQIFQQILSTFWQNTSKSYTYIICVPGMHDTQSDDVPRTGWVRVWAVLERQQSGLGTHTHDRCALHMWSHDAYKAD